MLTRGNITLLFEWIRTHTCWHIKVIVLMVLSKHLPSRRMAPPLHKYNHWSMILITVIIIRSSKSIIIPTRWHIQAPLPIPAHPTITASSKPLPFHWMDPALRK